MFGGGFMGSLHFIVTRIGIMNLVAAEVRRRIFGVHKSFRLLTSAATNRRFMEGIAAKSVGYLGAKLASI